VAKAEAMASNPTGQLCRFAVSEAKEEGKVEGYEGRSWERGAGRAARRPIQVCPKLSRFRLDNARDESFLPE